MINQFLLRFIPMMVLLLISGIHWNLHAQTLRDETKMELKPLQVGASLYFGQMFNVPDSLQERGNFNSSVTIPQTSLWMIQEALWNENLKFNLGIAGTFWYPFPEDNTKPWYSFRTGGIAIAQANGTYSAGNLGDPWFQATIGQQGYKYNPYAKNFGEYIFRSEAYPTTIRTGDWGPIDNAAAGIWGAALKFSFFGGLLKNDFLVTLANERVPLHDVSFSDIASVNLGKILTLGGGIKFSRLMQFDPKKSAPQDPKTGSFNWTASDQAALRMYIQEKVAADPNFLVGNIDFQRILVSGDTVVDTSLTIGGNYWAASKRPLVAFLSALPSQVDPRAVALGASKYNSIDYVDARTIFLMGRFSFDPKPLLKLGSIMSHSDLVLYSEASVVGLKNYPIYYTAVKQRLPIMVGFNFPTFRYLDFLTLEMEYMKNPHLNSDYIQATFRQPQPKAPDPSAEEIPSIADPYYDIRLATNPKAVNVNYTEDDFKWTITALKSFGPMNAAFQYGKDHYRPLTDAFRPALTEAGSSSNSKYYMLRLLINF